MSGLPDADGRAVRLNLVNVATFNPNRLTLHNGLLNDHRLLHDRRGGLDDNSLRVTRTRPCVINHASDHSADESRPEVASTRSPIAAVTMVIVVMRRMMTKDLWTGSKAIVISVFSYLVSSQKRNPTSFEIGHLFSAVNR